MIRTSSTSSNIDMENQQRRQTWDVFGFLMMMVNSQCGPKEVHLPDRHLCTRCSSNHYEDCEELCSMQSESHKSHYVNFCTATTETTTSESAYSGADSSVDAYADSSTPGNVTMDGNYSMGFQFWMVAAAASVGMALVAVHVGQRKERDTGEIMEDDDDAMSGGANVKGAVGRRMAAVSAFADGVINTGGAKSSKQVELSEYQLDDSPPPVSYPQSSFV